MHPKRLHAFKNRPLCNISYHSQIHAQLIIMDVSRPRPPHALLLPLPAQGHVAPMLTFSHLLAARGVIITFLNTQKAHARIFFHSEEDQKAAGEVLQKKKSSGIRFEAIPGGSQEPLPGSQTSFDMNSVMNILKGMEAEQGVIEEMVVSSRATAHPITCIIADSFLPWTCSLAKRLGIQRVIFRTTNGAVLAAAWELKSGKLKFPGSDDNGELTAGLPIVQSEFFSKLVQNPEHLNFIVERMKGLEDTTCIVVNTFQELEGPSLEACASCGTKVHHIGPLVPLGDHKGDSSVSFYDQESSCVEWLDKQTARSVLYVSLGSLAMLAPDALEELAFGIEESKQAFLWVFRNGNVESLPEGFLDRTRNRGLLVKWVPQGKVLEHTAVGAFLTHCGWNSVLEGISMGVSLLCYPLMHDQLLNALLVTTIWKLGISLSKDKQKGVITREEIKRGVSNILSAEEVHANSARWKGLAHSTLQEGGSSYHALEQFVDTLRSGV